MSKETYLPRTISAIRKAKIRLLEAYDNIELESADFESIRDDLERIRIKLDAALDKYNGEE